MLSRRVSRLRVRVIAWKLWMVRDMLPITLLRSRTSAIFDSTPTGRAKSKAASAPTWSASAVSGRAMRRPMYQPISSNTSSSVPLHRAWLNSSCRAPASSSTAGMAISTFTSLLVKFDSGTQMPYQSSPPT